MISHPALRLPVSIRSQCHLHCSKLLAWHCSLLERVSSRGPRATTYYVGHRTRGAQRRGFYSLGSTSSGLPQGTNCSFNRIAVLGNGTAMTASGRGRRDEQQFDLRSCLDLGFLTSSLPASELPDVHYLAHKGVDNMLHMAHCMKPTLFGGMYMMTSTVLNVKAVPTEGGDLPISRLLT